MRTVPRSALGVAWDRLGSLGVAWDRLESPGIAWGRLGSRLALSRLGCSALLPHTLATSVAPLMRSVRFPLPSSPAQPIHDHRRRHRQARPPLILLHHGVKPVHQCTRRRHGRARRQLVCCGAGWWMRRRRAGDVVCVPGGLWGRRSHSRSQSSANVPRRPGSGCCERESDRPKRPRVGHEWSGLSP